MRKIVLNISDTTYEKLRLEAIQLEKDIPALIAERLMHRPFSKQVEESFNEWLDQEVLKIKG